MPRGGLSNDPTAAQRQLDGLAKGREKTARKLLGLGEEETAPPASPSSSKPSDPPASGKRKTKSGSYGKAAPASKSRKRPARAKRASPASQPEPRDRPAPKRGGFLAGLRDGLSI